MPMTNPPHPGRIVRQECLDPLGLSVTDGVKALDVSRNALSEPVNERRGRPSAPARFSRMPSRPAIAIQYGWETA